MADPLAPIRDLWGVLRERVALELWGRPRVLRLPADDGRGAARVERDFPAPRVPGRIGAVDERTVQTTASYPARLVVENERLQRALRARLEEEQALRRVATLVARAHEPGAVLTRVTEEVGRHLR